MLCELYCVCTALKPVHYMLLNFRMQMGYAKSKIVMELKFWVHAK